MATTGPSTRHPSDTVIGHDLVGDGDLTIEARVDRSQGILISVKSTDSATFSVSVSHKDGDGNVFQAESASDLSLVNATDDYARLIRKGPRVEVTITDTSGAGQNNVNAFVDTQ